MKDDIEGPITITISRRSLEAAINCVAAGVDDRLEPQRYRDWYATTLAELRQAAVEGHQLLGAWDTRDYWLGLYNDALRDNRRLYWMGVYVAGVALIVGLSLGVFIGHLL